MLARTKEITLPESLKSDQEGFEFMTKLLNQTYERFCHYVFDFSEVRFFEANLSVILGAIYKEKKSTFITFGIKGMNNNNFLKTTLSNNGFLNLFDDKISEKKLSSGIPFRKFDMKNEAEFQNYIYNYVFEKHGIPELSPGAKKKIYRSIFEIYENAVKHSGASNIYVCGQSYGNKKRMALTMIDIGHSIKKNVNEFNDKYRNYSGKESINWAVQYGNTTKKGEAGGLGFDLIRNFLKLNKGKLQIYSANGYWQEKAGSVDSYDTKEHLLGTIINIEFNLLDKNNYVTDEEISLKDIF